MILSFNGGIGDTVYAIPVVKALLKKHKDISVLTKFPELWEGIPIKTIPKEKGTNYDLRISYIQRRKAKYPTTQFEDVCIEANINAPLELDWDIRNRALVEDIKQDGFIAGKKVCLIQPPYRPEYGTVQANCMAPDDSLYQQIADDIKKRFFIISIGNTEINYYTDKVLKDTSVTDLIDIAMASDLVISQVGHFSPIGEALNKPTLTIFTKAMLESPDPFLNTLTPNKLINKPTTRCCVDSDSVEEILSKIREIS